MGRRGVEDVVFSTGVNGTLYLTAVNVALVVPTRIATTAPRVTIRTRAIGTRSNVAIFPGGRTRCHVPTVMRYGSNGLVTFASRHCRGGSVNNNHRLSVIVGADVSGNTA